MKSIFTITIDFTLQTVTIPASKDAAMAYIDEHLAVSHMGQWHEVSGGGLIYVTDIGKTYLFTKVVFE